MLSVPPTNSLFLKDVSGASVFITEEAEYYRTITQWTNPVVYVLPWKVDLQFSPVTITTSQASGLGGQAYRGGR